MTSKDKEQFLAKYSRFFDGEINLHLRPAAKKLLINYSKVPEEEVESHILKVRQKAWNVHPFPCIGQFRFLDLGISLSPHYPTVLERLKTGNETYLDLGCCFGQDIRKLIYDGAPAEKMYGCDLRTDYFDCGYELFRDRETLKATLFEADVLNPESRLKDLHGKVDVIYVGSFIHLFPYELQIEVCKKIVGLLKDKEGSMVLGRQVGNANPGEYDPHVQGQKHIMRHNVETFGKMWEDVGKLTESEWRVEATLKTVDDKGMATSINAMPEEKKDEKDWIQKSRLSFAVFREAQQEGKRSYFGRQAW